MNREAWAIGVMRHAAQAASLPIEDFDFSVFAEVYEDARSVLESLYGPHSDVFAFAAIGVA